MQISQTHLFDTDSLTDQRIQVSALSPTQATFKGGLTLGVHRWFRLTASYAPELVRNCLDQMGTLPGMTVLDPFSGAGTTLIEGRKLGYKSLGFEINPLLAFVCQTSVNWNLDADCARSELDSIRSRFDSLKQLYSGSELSQHGFELPKIHNINRWWRPDVLEDLVLILNAIRTSSFPELYVKFFELALAAVLVPDLSNVTLGRLQLHFVNKDSKQIDVLSTFMNHATVMIGDLKDLDDSSPAATVFNIDSTDLTSIEGWEGSIDRVVTSPPYPNRYSYVWNTRPHLYMLGLINEASEASAIDKRAIGGTWGTATSALQKGVVEPLLPIIREVVLPLVNEIRPKDNLMANYIMNYFNKLSTQILEQDRFLKPRAELAYVVGCSRTKGIFIETDRILADIFDGLGRGYRTNRIERFRKRNSGKNLHESVVFVSKT